LYKTKESFCIKKRYYRFALKDIVKMHFFYSQTHPAASGAELIDEFKFINDFGFEAYKDIRQKPLEMHFNAGIEICFILKGRYDWIVEGEKYTLLPGDGFVTCPWQKHGSPREVVDLGEIFWIVIKPQLFNPNGEFIAGDWSKLTNKQNQFIGNVLSCNSNHKLSKANTLKPLFVELRNELEKKEFAYSLRVTNIVEEFLIRVVRHIQNRDKQFQQTQNRFKSFDLALRSKIAEKWTLEEMCKESGLGITSLTNFVKENTGYTPANYLIFIRIEMAKEILKTSQKKLTNIALDCGFYSSQHFSSTFSKWVGISPLHFRKVNQHN
jgi:AraC-like DNA-binding protein